MLLKVPDYVPRRIVGAATRPQQLKRVVYLLLAGPGGDVRAEHAHEITTVLEELVAAGKLREERFIRAIDRARRVPELEAVANDLWDRVEGGRLAMAREEARIKEAIQMLNGNLRARQLGEGRLVAAGEYAVPYLLHEMTAGSDERLKLRCADVLTKVGRTAVTPLSVALPEIGDSAVQASVCGIIADIQHPHAAAALWDVAQDSEMSGPVRDAASRAFRSIGGSEGELSQLYTDLGQQYFANHSSLIAYPEEDTNNVWGYDQHIGLFMTPVPTPVYTDVMAMRMASKALKINPSNQEALSLFVAADLRRGNDLPDGADDLVYGDLKYSPEFYATVFGTGTCLDVLAMGIASVDTPLVLDAISALSKTTGGVNLFQGGSEGQPLLDALSYPDRRVQYEAALTLARALPSQSFGRDHAVVPLLATAVRTGGQSFATVIAGDDEDRRVLVGALESMGFTIVGAEANAPSLRPALASAFAVDLVVMKPSSLDDARSALAELQAGPKTLASPIVVLGNAELGPLRLEHAGDRRLKFTRYTNDEALANAVTAVMDTASGGMITEAEAEEYAIRSLDALRDIAICQSSVYNIADAEPALLEAIDQREGGIKMFIAEILSLTDSEVAQRKLFDVALNASGGEQVDLLGHVAASVRHLGSTAEQRQLDSLLELIKNGDGPVAEAAAMVHGSLNRRATPAAIELIP